MANQNGERKQKEVIALPEGRLINHALFEKDVYVDPQTQKPGTPRYKVEMAFDPDALLGERKFEDKCADFAEEKWGKDFGQMFIDGKLIGPWVDGNVLAKRREEIGKPGDAYKGKLVIRADTQYNLHGQDAPGGVQVWDEEVKPITIVNGTNLIWPGCYGIVAVTLHGYEATDNRGNKDYCLKCYLVAFQRTRGDDKDRLSTPRDTSTLFKPLGRTAGAASGGERRRRPG